ncbi:MAG: extracellular solute-binding protein [Desulfobacterales bacterium]|nr:extracellular solute-binding protein [Desulfobacterales bacterium]
MKKLFGSVYLAAVFLMVFATVPVSGETLRILTWEGYEYKDYHQSFIELVKKKYDVSLKLDISYVMTDDDFFPALRDGKTDVITPSHHIAKDKRFRLIDHKLVLPINTDNIPNFRHIIPALQKPEFYTKNNVLYGVSFQRGASLALAYNADIVSKAPTTWNVLWEPKYKDRYVTGKDTYEQNCYIAALAMGISRDKIGDYRTLNTPQFQKKLAQLAANAHSMWGSAETPKDLEGMSVAAIYGIALPELKKMGRNWKIATPLEGTTGYLNPFMIGDSLKDKPLLKQIAEEWINYVLTDELQVYTARQLLLSPVTTTVAARLTPEEIVQHHLDNVKLFEKYNILFPRLGKLDRQGLKRLWEHALKQK